MGVSRQKVLYLPYKKAKCLKVIYWVCSSISTQCGTIWVQTKLMVLINLPHPQIIATRFYCVTPGVYQIIM